MIQLHIWVVINTKYKVIHRRMSIIRIEQNKIDFIIFLLYFIILRDNLSAINTLLNEVSSQFTISFRLFKSSIT